MGQAKLTDIPGIGPHTAQVLVDSGIETAEALASLSVEQLVGIPGFGPARAAAVGQAIARLKQPSPGVEAPTSKAKKQGKKKKKKKKKKNDGKKKSGRKSKQGKTKNKSKKKKGKKGKGKKRK